MDIPLLVRVEAGGDKRPELVEDPRARQDDPHQKRRLHIHPERLLGAQGGDADARILDHRLPEEHRHEVIHAKACLFVLHACGRGGRRRPQDAGQPVGVDLAEFERHAVVLDGIDHLPPGVGEGRAPFDPGRPRVERLDGPIGVVVGQSSLERLLDEMDERPGDGEADEHGDQEPHRGLDEARPEFLQVLPEGHRRILEQVFVVDAGHGCDRGGRVRYDESTSHPAGMPGSLFSRGNVRLHTCPGAGRGPSPGASSAWPGRSRSRRGGTRAPRTSPGRPAGRCRRQGPSAPDAKNGS